MTAALVAVVLAIAALIGAMAAFGLVILFTLALKG